MASQLKNTIARTLYNAWQSKISVRNFNEFFECFNFKQNTQNKVIWRIQLPLKEHEVFDDVLFKSLKDELSEYDAVKSVTQNIEIENLLYVELDNKYFVKDVLESQPTSLNYQKSSKKVIVEFSSPNIAKQFHVGHLRSTMIGNCIANVKRKLGDEVVKMNYLGDWGTQLGLLQVGLKMENLKEEDFRDDPLKVLLKAYVNGNKEAETNPELNSEARKFFHDLEFGDKEAIESWSQYREWTLRGLKNIYNRLGVSFDEFEWESNYNREKANTVLEMLEKKGLLLVDDLGRKVAVTENKNFPLIKSDNTTLYLMRDLSAVFSRKCKHNFDEMYYVVDNGQSEHFNALLTLSTKLNINKNNIQHVKFGKIQGMSTRKGRFTPLSDVLNEARNRVFEIQRMSENTKVLLQTKDTADILGVSSIIVNDLKRRRIKDYQFSWDDALKMNESTGIVLQYTHCRLHSLQENSDGIASECDPEVLQEPEVLSLVQEIAKFEEKLVECNNKLEPCTLTIYLLDLVRAINSAYVRLRVKRSDAHVAQQRSLLFSKSKEVLNEGMRLLGLKPLNEM